MTPCRPLWKRLLRRPVLTTARGVEMAASLAFISPLYQMPQALRLGRAAAPAPPVRTALVVHAYYPELWPEIVKVWQDLPAGSPLLVTTPPGKASQIRALGAENPLIEIYECENRGRDVAPFLRLLSAGRLDRFDAVLKIHTKKSPHLRQGSLRRRVFYTALAGHPGNVRRILRQFSDPRVGLVGLAPFFRTSDVYWMDNKALIENLCQRMGPKAPVRLGFFEGSMFWVRPQALAPLRALDLQPDDFDAEAGQFDGTLHHAVERIFTLSALAVGYETRSIRGKTLLPPAVRPEILKWPRWQLPQKQVFAPQQPES
jgi:lipopolysaccharide biosynthesis protein